MIGNDFYWLDAVLILVLIAALLAAFWLRRQKRREDKEDGEDKGVKILCLVALVIELILFSGCAVKNPDQRDDQDDEMAIRDPKEVYRFECHVMGTDRVTAIEVPRKSPMNFRFTRECAIVHE